MKNILMPVAMLLIVLTIATSAYALNNKITFGSNKGQAIPTSEQLDQERSQAMINLLTQIQQQQQQTNTLLADLVRTQQAQLIYMKKMSEKNAK